jgi:predicted molibdopterin-dependent oxidoreductase YjgC
MPDWMIISEIATRLGYEMCYSKPSEIMDEITKVAPIYNGITHHRLEEEDLRWPCTSSTHEGTRILHKDRFSRGKGLFQSIEYRPPAETPDQNYPYILTTGRKLFHWHTGTMTRRSETLTDQLNEAYVEINNTDAKNLGITSDDIVQVSSRRGDIRLNAEATDRIKQGVVFIPFHFAEAAANKLTNNALDPIAKIPEFKVCAVKIEKID